MIKGILHAKLYGYTSIELGDLNRSTGSLKGIEIVERRNVAPRDNLVLECPTDVSGWDITEDRFLNDYILIDGDEGND